MKTRSVLCALIVGLLGTGSARADNSDSKSYAIVGIVSIVAARLPSADLVKSAREEITRAMSSHGFSLVNDPTSAGTVVTVHFERQRYEIEYSPYIPRSVYPWIGATVGTYMPVSTADAFDRNPVATCAPQCLAKQN